ncbi:MAG: glycerol-3-phosphate 1-O-acyltransferase PlsY [Candidatus Neomarinimicrobiota bacterium]
MIRLLAVPVLSYLVGSFPTSIVMGRTIGKIDIREHGSGNAGMTNILRVLGWKPAVVVGIGDVFKGWFATSFVPLLAVGRVPLEGVTVLQIMAASAAVLGHSYTIFGGFRGGKGVATFMGVIISLFPAAIPFCLATFVIALISTGYVSVGSIAAALMLPIAVFFLSSVGLGNPESSLKIFSLVVPIFVVFTHRNNIRRLKEGSENRFDRVRVFRRTGKSGPLE